MGKKYEAALAKVDRSKEYAPQDAVKLLKEIKFSSFDETVELHLRLGIDPRHSDQQVRNSVVLPHGLGKVVRILVFAEGEAAQIARDAGADYIGDDEVINRINNEGWVDFDVALSTPDMMKKVGRLGKVLGRRGLMPNPKAGTVIPAEDIQRAIDEARAGRIEYRNDKTGNLHVPLGKISFDEDKILGNMAALMESLVRSRPSAVKGKFIRRIVLTSTMTPGIRVDTTLAETMF
ncbi:MAG: 50S ribosomal protein L1 [Anaerolineae bacterium]|nr:MAG: 50S ribosomal protein L1 [Anaerolineae bacterium]MCL4880546.1 50S ribosomal protein L1 [Anaerolineae bacterium]